MTLTRAWGKVSADKDQLSSARSRQSLLNPSAPPIIIATFRPLPIQVFNTLARHLVVTVVPVSFNATR